MGLSRLAAWTRLRIPWAMARSLDALGTHWVSLLKDTSALTVLAIPELTTVVRSISVDVGFGEWLVDLASAAALYLAATLVLVRGLDIWSRQGMRKGGVTA